jgi:hypothetical protein
MGPDIHDHVLRVAQQLVGRLLQLAQKTIPVGNAGRFD